MHQFWRDLTAGLHLFGWSIRHFTRWLKLGPAHCICITCHQHREEGWLLLRIVEHQGDPNRLVESPVYLTDPPMYLPAREMPHAFMPTRTQEGSPLADALARRCFICDNPRGHQYHV